MEYFVASNKYSLKSYDFEGGGSRLSCFCLTTFSFPFCEHPVPGAVSPLPSTPSSPTLDFPPSVLTEPKALSSSSLSLFEPLSSSSRISIALGFLGNLTSAGSPMSKKATTKVSRNEGQYMLDNVDQCHSHREAPPGT